jgi:hypothetical protein
LIHPGEIKGGPAADVRLCPDISAMPSDNSLNYSQADAGTGVFLARMKSLERLKELIRILHIETSAIITDEINCGPIHRLFTEFQPGLRAFTGEFPGILQEVSHQPTNFETILCSAFSFCSWYRLKARFCSDLFDNYVWIFCFKE